MPDERLPMSVPKVQATPELVDICSALLIRVTNDEWEYERRLKYPNDAKLEKGLSNIVSKSDEYLWFIHDLKKLQTLLHERFDSYVDPRVVKNLQLFDRFIEENEPAQMSFFSQTEPKSQIPSIKLPQHIVQSFSTILYSRYGQDPKLRRVLESVVYRQDTTWWTHHLLKLVSLLDAELMRDYDVPADVSDAFTTIKKFLDENQPAQMSFFSGLNEPRFMTREEAEVWCASTALPGPYYHGKEPGRGGSSNPDRSTLGPGLYVTPDRNYAAFYGSTIYELRLNVSKPFSMEDNEQYVDSRTLFDEFIESAHDPESKERKEFVESILRDPSHLLDKIDDLEEPVFEQDYSLSPEERNKKWKDYYENVFKPWESDTVEKILYDLISRYDSERVDEKESKLFQDLVEEWAGRVLEGMEIPDSLSVGEPVPPFYLDVDGQRYSVGFEPAPWEIDVLSLEGAHEIRGEVESRGYDCIIWDNRNGGPEVLIFDEDRQVVVISDPLEVEAQATTNPWQEHIEQTKKRHRFERLPDYSPDRPPEEVRRIPLYHATTALSAVLEQGLKSRDELGPGSNRGLAGGPSDLVSATWDLNLVRHIAHALQLGRAVAAGEMGLAELVDFAKAGGWYDSMVKTWSYGAYGRGDEEFSRTELDQIMLGLEYRGGYGDSSTDLGIEGMAFGEDDIERLGAEPIGDGWQGRDQHYWAAAWVPMPTERRRDYDVAALQAFLRGAELAGIAEDPMFFTTNWESLAQVPAHEIGVVELRLRPDTDVIYVHAMGEVRGPGAAFEVVRAIPDLDLVASLQAQPIPMIEFLPEDHDTMKELLEYPIDSACWNLYRSLSYDRNERWMEIAKRMESAPAIDEVPCEAPIHLVQKALEMLYELSDVDYRSADLARRIEAILERSNPSQMTFFSQSDGEEDLRTGYEDYVDISPLRRDLFTLQNTLSYLGKKKSPIHGYHDFVHEKGTLSWRVNAAISRVISYKSPIKEHQPFGVPRQFVRELYELLKRDEVYELFTNAAAILHWYSSDQIIQDKDVGETYARNLVSMKKLIETTPGTGTQLTFFEACAQQQPSKTTGWVDLVTVPQSFYLAGQDLLGFLSAALVNDSQSYSKVVSLIYQRYAGQKKGLVPRQVVRDVLNILEDGRVEAFLDRPSYEFRPHLYSYNRFISMLREMIAQPESGPRQKTFFEAQTTTGWEDWVDVYGPDFNRHGQSVVRYLQTLNLASEKVEKFVYESTKSNVRPRVLTQQVLDILESKFVKDAVRKDRIIAEKFEYMHRIMLIDRYNRFVEGLKQMISSRPTNLQKTFFEAEATTTGWEDWVPIYVPSFRYDGQRALDYVAGLLSDEDIEVIASFVFGDYDSTPSIDVRPRAVVHAVLDILDSEWLKDLIRDEVVEEGDDETQDMIDRYHRFVSGLKQMLRSPAVNTQKTLFEASIKDPVKTTGYEDWVVVENQSDWVIHGEVVKQNVSSLLSMNDRDLLNSVVFGINIVGLPSRRHRPRLLVEKVKKLLTTNPGIQRMVDEGPMWLISYDKFLEMIYRALEQMLKTPSTETQRTLFEAQSLITTGYTDWVDLSQDPGLRSLFSDFGRDIFRGLRSKLTMRQEMLFSKTLYGEYIEGLPSPDYRPRAILEECHNMLTSPLVSDRVATMEASFITTYEEFLQILERLIDSTPNSEIQRTFFEAQSRPVVSDEAPDDRQPWILVEDFFQVVNDGPYAIPPAHIARLVERGDYDDLTLLLNVSGWSLPGRIDRAAVWEGALWVYIPGAYNTGLQKLRRVSSLGLHPPLDPQDRVAA